MRREVVIRNQKYVIVPTRRFKTSYGYAGRKGIEVFKPGDTSQTSERYTGMREFRQELAMRRRLFR